MGHMSFSLRCQPCLRWQQLPAAQLLLPHPKAQTCPGLGATIPRDSLGPLSVPILVPGAPGAFPEGTEQGHRAGLGILSTAGTVIATPGIVTTMVPGPES